jgi:hypothetical protein
MRGGGAAEGGGVAGEGVPPMREEELRWEPWGREM